MLRLLPFTEMIAFSPQKAPCLVRKHLKQMFCWIHNRLLKSLSSTINPVAATALLIVHFTLLLAKNI